MSALTNFLMNVLVNKYALGSLVSVWNKATGFKTQVLVPLAILVLAAGFFQMIPLDLAFTVATSIFGAAGSTLMDKLNRHKGLIEELSNRVKEKAASEALVDKSASESLDKAVAEAKKDL
jgi:hypothetical protein